MVIIEEIEMLLLFGEAIWFLRHLQLEINILQKEEIAA